jgi:hypothetical protein
MHNGSQQGIIRFRDPRLDAMSRSALCLLERYQSVVDASVKPDARSYGMVMDAMAVKASLKVKRCHAPVKGKGKACRDQSQNGQDEIQLLRDTLELLDEKSKTGDPFIAPITFTYNMLLGQRSFAACECSVGS